MPIIKSKPGRGGIFIILCQKIAISPEPNLRWTSDQSVNSSFSVVVQKKKTRVLYLSRFNHGGPSKFENTFSQIVKLSQKGHRVSDMRVTILEKIFSSDPAIRKERERYFIVKMNTKLKGLNKIT